MPLDIGAAAPPFQLPCKPGEIIDVGKHIGRDTLVLLFFPLAFSPVCTAEMCSFRDNWKKWEKLEAQIFGVSVDSPFVVERFRAEEKIPFPILSDFNKEVARTYGVLHEDLKGLKGVAKRSVFVIDQSGQVAWRWVTEDPKVQVDFDAVRAALAGLASAV